MGKTPTEWFKSFKFGISWASRILTEQRPLTGASFPPGEKIKFTPKSFILPVLYKTTVKYSNTGYLFL